MINDKTVLQIQHNCTFITLYSIRVTCLVSSTKPSRLLVLYSTGSVAWRVASRGVLAPRGSHRVRLRAPLAGRRVEFSCTYRGQRREPRHHNGIRSNINIPYTGGTAELAGTRRACVLKGHAHSCMWLYSRASSPPRPLLSGFRTPRALLQRLCGRVRREQPLELNDA